MEDEDASDGYHIANAQLPILLKLRRIADLKPHEQTVESDLSKLVTTLKRGPVLRHPIITDETTGLVLDGTHRLAALKRLNYDLVPCADVDYQNPSILVERWYREIHGGNLDAFCSDMNSKRPSRVSSVQADECLRKRLCYASLQNATSCYALNNQTGDAMGLARSAYEIEEIAREKGLTIIYSDDSSVPTDEDRFLLSTITLGKNEIITSCLAGETFPPKTTRHVIPSRPLAVSVPMKLLAGSDLGKAQKQFVSHLRRLRVRRLPEGAWIGSRRYQEEVFLFE